MQFLEVRGKEFLRSKLVVDELKKPKRSKIGNKDSKSFLSNGYLAHKQIMFSQLTSKSSASFDNERGGNIELQHF